MSYRNFKESKKYHSNYSKTHKEEMKKRRTKKRSKIRDFLNEYKSYKGCKKCGEKDFACLDFHHADEEKKNNNICKMVRKCYSIETIKKEIELCIILCANCHRKLHYGPIV
jgi:hypothetical protein